MTSSRPNILSHLPGRCVNSDRMLVPLLAVLASVTGLILLLVVIFLLRESWPLIGNNAWQGLFTDEAWYPLEGSFSVLPMLWATLVVALGAMVLAVPLGLASALFVNFYAPALLAKIYRMILALMAGVPSVVYGLWGLTVLVPRVAAWQPPGASLFTATLVLTLMILPTIALTSSSALHNVPPRLFHGASALGLGRLGIIVGVAIPAARNSIIGGMLLACARALGETMAVLMVAGNVVQMPDSLFDPVRVLTANIALEMAYATGDHRASLFASGLILTLFVLALAWWGMRITWRVRHG